MLNWIVWTRTVFDIELVYISYVEFFEIELMWHLTVCKLKTILILFFLSVKIIKPAFGDPFLCQSPWQFYAFDFEGQILFCAYTIS